jgi:hypothetical protein
MIKNAKRILFFLSILIFVISLTQPAYYIDRADYDAWANSFYLLIFGWSGLLAGGAAFAWLANPLILLSWILFFTKPKAALILSLLATLFAISFLFFNTIISSEETSYSTITARKAGYWLWLLSIALFSIASTILYYIDKQSQKRKLIDKTV